MKLNLDTWQQWWNLRQPREQTAIKAATLLIVASVVWSWGLAPALETLRTYDSQRQQLDRDLQAMLNLQAQAQALRNITRLSSDAASSALTQAAEKSFGKQAEIVTDGAQATITLRNVPPDKLAQWLYTARTEAQSLPVEASLNRSAEGWSGTLRMSLPNS